MRDVWWFANFCPFFTVFDLDEFVRVFENTEVTEKKLRELGFKQALLFLQKHSEKWKQRREFLEKTYGPRNLGIIFWGDLHFPAKLKTLFAPPAVLFVRGSLHQKKPVVAVVGARNPTQIGRLWVQKVIPELCRRGCVIASGGARGIDAEAHFAALKARGETWAFLPGGVGKPYPGSHASLFDEILERGALISEFTDDVVVRRENFQRRNRLIAGVADVVIIVEAGLRSGTIMTANLATAEGRDILVVPGPPLVESYSGSLELLYTGASLARDENDIIFHMETKIGLKLKP